VTVTALDNAPKGYVDFDKGAAKKFVLDPHSLLPA
jgi:glutathione-independent formaldehyde dehydrogenase